MTRRRSIPGRAAVRGRAGGFTLAELIVASIILTMVVGATTISISQMLRSRDAAGAAGDAFGRAQSAVNRMALDAVQALRDADLTSAKVAIVRGGPAGRTSQGLLLFTHQVRPVRAAPDAREGDEFEVQFRLEPAIPTSGTGSAQPAFTLWRRADPVPDEVIDGGGVAAPLVDGVTSLSIEAYDGSAWRMDWDSDADGYPHALRITVTATDDSGRRTATAQRVIALDRTPKPVAEEADHGEGSEDSSGGAGGAASSGGAASGGTGATGGTGGTGTAGGGAGRGGSGGGGTGGGSGGGGRGGTRP